MNYLQAYLHSKVTTILSPTPSTKDTDYEIEETLSIHDKIISQRQAELGTYSNFTTPTKQKLKSPYTNSSNTSTIEIPRHRTPPRYKNSGVDETEKIREFVDIKKMLKSLRSLENLITEPNVDYEFFKKTYIESSYGLINSMNEIPQNSFPPTQQQGLKEVVPRDVESRELIIKIGIVGVQILVVLMDLLTPICIQIINFGKVVLGNELVQKVLNVVVEMVWVLLSITLDYLKRFQQRAEQRNEQRRINR